jgi:hypothetical protein
VPSRNVPVRRLITVETEPGSTVRTYTPGERVTLSVLELSLDHSPPVRGYLRPPRSVDAGCGLNHPTRQPCASSDAYGQPDNAFA